ncbi:MAG: cell wall hydrolase [Methyloceanibacter sp.]|uniref:cell wall hydrolase n=1 Tax=Methyloceanibacter sp. TaxID=1965321 RepID=UPI003D6D4DD7
MRRRSSRRMWHTVAALVPLPLIGLGCLAFVPGNPLAVEVELYLSDPGSVYTATRTADATAAPRPIPREAEKLFTSGRKGPRADHYAAAQAVTDAGKQIITASLTGSAGLARPVAAVSRAAKADRLNPTTTDVALKGPVGGNSLFMNASHTSPFSADFQVDAFRPSTDEIAYSPSSEALGFRYQGETQAEFEERERRCLATAIYFEARGEPVRGQIAVGQVILNRVRSPLFPETICGVVYQGQMHPGCQFSFTCDGKTDNPSNKVQWALAQDLAKQIMSGEQWLPEVGYSTFYHANYVSPYWVRGMNKIDKIGRHIFYKKRNEQPYLVEASVEAEDASDTDDDSGYLLPTLSLASAVGAVTGSVSAVAGSSAPQPTPAMSLGFAGSE